MNMSSSRTVMPNEASDDQTVGEVAVELRGLTKRYGQVTAVRDVDLTVREGELIAVLGASGSGKTTLLRMMAGFESVSEGSISLFGQDVSRLSPADRDIGMVFQNYALMPHLTVRRNIEYGLRMRGWPRARRKERVSEMLRVFRLDDHGSRLPNQLSGGQQQRVAIARALAYSPKLLLMDEPMGALDKALKQELLAEIRRVHRQFGTTIFYVTHDREEALTLADRVALMSDSRLVDCSPVQDMYLHPRTRLAAEFFAGANVIPIDIITNETTGVGSAATGPVVTKSNSTNAKAGHVAVRPRDIAIASENHDWTFRALVEDTVFLGDDVRISARLNDSAVDQVVTVMLPLSNGRDLNTGDHVRFGVHESHMHLIQDDYHDLNGGR